MIQTNTLTSHCKGLNRLIDPKQITRPRGIEKRRVRKNICRVVRKPPNRASVTSINITVVLVLIKTNREFPDSGNSLCL